MQFATYDLNGLHFYSNDPLGTRRAQTDYAGIIEQTCSSWPFGDFLQCNGTTPNALVDLTYNDGTGALTTRMSPSLMKDMNAGDYTGMSGQLRYTMDSAGNVEPGSVTRSDDRIDIFLSAGPDSQ